MQGTRPHRRNQFPAMWRLILVNGDILIDGVGVRVFRHNGTS